MEQKLKYGGTAIMWNKKLNAKIFMNQDQSIIGLEVCLDSSSLNFINVYMPHCCDPNYDDYILVKFQHSVMKLTAQMY